LKNCKNRPTLGAFPDLFYPDETAFTQTLLPRYKIAKIAQTSPNKYEGKC